MTEHRQHTIHVHMDQTCPRSNSHRILRPIQSDLCMISPNVHHCTDFIHTINVCWFCHTHSIRFPFHSDDPCSAVNIHSSVKSLYLCLCDGVHVLSIETMSKCTHPYAMNSVFTIQFIPHIIHRRHTDVASTAHLRRFHHVSTILKSERRRLREESQYRFVDVPDRYVCRLCIMPGMKWYT